VDLATAPVLADAIHAAFDEHARVIIDLNGVPYLDSAGLHVLAKSATRHAGHLAIVQATPRVRRLFEILGLIGMLPVATSLAEAQDYLSGGNGHTGGGSPDGSSLDAADGGG
jgi:anti-anti-sigma factor